MAGAECGMPPEIDIYRSAKLLIDQHGEDAPIFAAMQAASTLRLGMWPGRRYGWG